MKDKRWRLRSHKHRVEMKARRWTVTELHDFGRELMYDEYGVAAMFLVTKFCFRGRPALVSPVDERLLNIALDPVERRMKADRDFLEAHGAPRPLRFAVGVAL